MTRMTRIKSVIIRENLWLKISFPPVPTCDKNTRRHLIPRLSTPHQSGKKSMQPNRRAFLHRVGAATVAAGVIGVEPLLQPAASEVHAAPGPNQRANDCAKLRRDAATTGLKATPQNLQHPDNNDE